ncbi:hypothetical protein JAAARDRAFT_151426 [Jaapia argillacea MUCL 33604]|uniref:Tuberous sclerosis 1 n=1 Tax=Jaapia argillacea MUCL 33604 TaxID=933084 RepID=A0A067QB59_9AGAM|nr:hypothetical protein JAAARDRAFT_151426 [Jaapia argillacea MUCL 33604]
MSVADISRQLRLLLEGLPDAQPLSQVLALIDSFVREHSESPDLESLLPQLDDELQEIHQDVLDHTSIPHTEAFLSVLYHLRPVLTSSSIIGTWFDLLLRPALREPKLTTTAMGYAKDLIITALTKVSEIYVEKVGNFRRRLLDLYLLDTHNEGSEEDVLEWASSDQTQRAQRKSWKANLEDILVTYGLGEPEDFFTELHSCFATTTSRLQLLTLLNSYTLQPSFSSQSAVLIANPLMSSLIHSLLLDSSSIVCISSLTLLCKLLPVLAVHAAEGLKRILPQLLAILARVVCWRQRPPPQDPVETVDDFESEIEDQPRFSPEHLPFPAREDLNWEQLEVTFACAMSSPPSPNQYFTYLYYLFPCNVVRFLRSPLLYLSEHGLGSPYSVPWDDVIDETELHSKSESMLRSHVLHPLLLWGNASEELAEPRVWTKYTVSRIVGECTMLEVRNAALGYRAREALEEDHNTSLGELRDDTVGFPTPTPHIIDLSTTAVPPRISIQDMVATSLVLKSSQDIMALDTPPGWPPGLLSATATSTPSKRSINLPSDADSLRSYQGDIPLHVAQAITSLQREVLLLRNELNFELWLNRENVKQIGRLYQGRILSRNAEIERQGLHNKLREYRMQVTRLQKDLKEYKSQTSASKAKYVIYHNELQAKIREFREQKQTWSLEATTIRNENKEVKAKLEAQGSLLADATKTIFSLRIQIKENQPKIDRLRDYELQIEQLTKILRLRDADAQKYKDQAEMIQGLLSKCKKLEVRLDTYEKFHAEKTEKWSAERRYIRELQARSLLAEDKAKIVRLQAEEITGLTAEREAMAQSIKKLQDGNAELTDEIEELKAMLDMLKAQVSGRRGLVSDPRMSPILSLGALV